MIEKNTFANSFQTRPQYSSGPIQNTRTNVPSQIFTDYTRNTRTKITPPVMGSKPNTTNSNQFGVVMGKPNVLGAPCCGGRKTSSRKTSLFSTNSVSSTKEKEGFTQEKTISDNSTKETKEPDTLNSNNVLPIGSTLPNNSLNTYGGGKIINDIKYESNVSEENKWVDITNELSDLKSALRDCRDDAENLYQNYLNTVNGAWLGNDKELFDTIFEDNRKGQDELFEKMTDVYELLEEANNKNNASFERRQEKSKELFSNLKVEK